MSELIILENDFLKATFKPIGAELCSLFDKKAKAEHVWQADKEVWGRHAPILFPIVGQVEDNEYRIGDQKFSLSQHGFARDLPFETLEKEETKLVFVLKSSTETAKLYPYKFELYVTYTLERNALQIKYDVKNKDDRTIYFSIGAHPGFVCPFSAVEQFSDYQLKFEQKESANRLLFEKGLLTGRKETFLSNEDVIPLDYPLFDNDAIILEGLSSSWVDLRSEHTGRYLRFYFKGFPLLAFWTYPGKGAPYICIEPWHGIADVRGTNKDYTQKDFIESLAVEKTFTCEYAVEIGG